MKQYNILHRGVPLVFMGDLLSRTSSKPRNDPERDKWTDFEIFLTEENKLVVNIVNVTPNGDAGNRSFVCEGFFDVEKCLTHPVYGTMSFAAQKCYKEALEYAIECGLV
ncbi:hypothetical protein EOM81_10930, partial [bacterium]|nr:hypothetical protein [bacterium]